VQFRHLCFGCLGPLSLCSGFVVRTMDPDDRRRVVVTLTPAGDKVLAGHKVFGGSPIALAVQDMTAKQQQDLARNLEALIHLARRHAGRDADE